MLRRVVQTTTGAALALASARAHATPPEEVPPEPPPERQHLTGEWGGTRGTLGDHGLTIDAFYAAEYFQSWGGETDGHDLLGHIEIGVTLDTAKAGLWSGGKLYALFQSNHGVGIDEDVGSAAPISNLEVVPGPQAYTQLGEFFLEQTFADGRVLVRLGKQDANRDFGTPRFAGNFTNGNFGMYPSAPLPSYPATGLGAYLNVAATPWLAVRAAVYEGSPQLGSYGFDSAFGEGGGAIVVGGVAASRHYGPAERDDGVTTFAVWRQSGSFDALDTSGRTFDTDHGFFVQHDEHIYQHPTSPHDASGLTLILRFAWAQSDRTLVSRDLECSAAWHGFGFRHDDTLGLGVGAFTVGTSTHSGLPGEEEFVEAFYKWRATPYASLQPDVQLYRHPGGDGRSAVLVGARVKLKL